VLRPFEPTDADPLFAACQDADIQRWTRVPSPYERQHAEDFVRHQAPDGWRDGTAYGFAVVTRGDGVLVGSVGLVRLAPADRQAELGYWTARGQRRRGYTAEAARALVAWAFTELGVERMDWCAEVGNEGSRALALTLGFRMEGTERARIVRGRTRRDAWRAALLPSDWQLPSATTYLPAPRQGAG
jgi:RimJ/RimL family protein N-acetyltransferase